MHGINFTMNLSWVILMVLGVTVSLIFTIVLIWFSKKNISANVARRDILHMLNTQGMSVKEILETVNESTSIPLERVPLMLVKLQEEGLIERQGINRYVITSNGLETLKNLDAISKEFQRVERSNYRMNKIHEIGSGGFHGIPT